MSTPAEIPTVTEACPDKDEAAEFWGGERAQAWVGLMETHARLMKALDAQLVARHGIGLSGYVLLARLAQAEDGKLRMSELAEQALLSPSRASRLVDELVVRGYVERRPCESDSRVVYAALTEPGSEFLEEAQGTHFSQVEAAFFGPLSESDVKALIRIWRRLGKAAA